tara:strand:+ start:616 stop:1623 length:1008 start_codon:yes stop_codon:yes gene_type:complete
MAVSQIDPNGLNVGQLGGSRNMVINGAMEVAQRGTSATAGGYVSLDRWLYNTSGGSGTFSQETNANPSETDGIRTYARVNISSSSDYTGLIHRIEDVTKVKSGTVTLSFWAKGTAPVGGLYLFCTQDFGTSGSADVDISGILITSTLTSSWVKYETQVTIPSVDGKTINAGSFFSLAIMQGTNTSSTAYDLNITGVQLEVSPTGEATPFEHENYGTTLAKCQRYYERLNGPAGWYNAHGYATNIYLVIEWKVPKRTASGSVYYSNTNFASMITAYGNTGGSSAIDGVITGVSTSIMGVTALGLDVALSASTYTPFGSSVMYRLDASHWIAYDAEL